MVQLLIFPTSCTWIKIFGWLPVLFWSFSPFLCFTLHFFLFHFEASPPSCVSLCTSCHVLFLMCPSGSHHATTGELVLIDLKAKVRNLTHCSSPNVAAERYRCQWQTYTYSSTSECLWSLVNLIHDKTMTWWRSCRMTANMQKCIKLATQNKQRKRPASISGWLQGLQKEIVFKRSACFCVGRTYFYKTNAVLEHLKITKFNMLMHSCCCRCKKKCGVSLKENECKESRSGKRMRKKYVRLSSEQRVLFKSKKNKNKKKQQDLLCFSTNKKTIFFLSFKKLVNSPFLF